MLENKNQNSEPVLLIATKKERKLFSEKLSIKGNILPTQPSLILQMLFPFLSVLVFGFLAFLSYSYFSNQAKIKLKEDLILSFNLKDYERSFELFQKSTSQKKIEVSSTVELNNFFQSLFKIATFLKEKKTESAILLINELNFSTIEDHLNKNNKSYLNIYLKKLSETNSLLIKSFEDFQNKSIRLPQALEELSLKISNHLKIGKIKIEEFARIFNLKPMQKTFITFNPETQSYNFAPILYYKVGLLAELPLIEKIPDNIKDKVQLSNILNKLKVSLNINSAQNIAAEFDKKIRENRLYFKNFKHAYSNFTNEYRNLTINNKINTFNSNNLEKQFLSNLQNLIVNFL